MRASTKTDLMQKAAERIQKLAADTIAALKDDPKDSSVKSFASKFLMGSPDLTALENAHGSLTSKLSAPESVRVGVFGIKASGKSTLVNAVLRTNAVPSKVSTIVPIEVSHNATTFTVKIDRGDGTSETKDGLSVKELGPTLEEASRPRDVDKPASNATWVSVDGPFPGLVTPDSHRQLEIIDLPGDLDTNARVRELLQAGLHECDALVVVIELPRGEPLQSDRDAVQRFKQQGGARPLYVCLSKFDSREQSYSETPQETSAWLDGQQRKIFQDLNWQGDGRVFAVAARPYAIAHELEKPHVTMKLAIEQGFGAARSGIDHLREMLISHTEPERSAKIREIEIAGAMESAVEEVRKTIKWLRDSAVKVGICTQEEADQRPKDFNIKSFEIRDELEALEGLASKHRGPKDHQRGGGPCCLGACDQKATTDGPTKLPSCDKHSKCSEAVWKARGIEPLRIPPPPPPKCASNNCYFPAYIPFKWCFSCCVKKKHLLF